MRAYLSLCVDEYLLPAGSGAGGLIFARDWTNKKREGERRRADKQEQDG